MTEYYGPGIILPVLCFLVAAAIPWIAWRNAERAIDSVWTERDPSAW